MSSPAQGYVYVVRGDHDRLTCDLQVSLERAYGPADTLDVVGADLSLDTLERVPADTLDVVGADLSLDTLERVVTDLRQLAASREPWDTLHDMRLNRRA